MRSEGEIAPHSPRHDRLADRDLFIYLGCIDGSVDRRLYPCAIIYHPSCHVYRFIDFLFRRTIIDEFIILLIILSRSGFYLTVPIDQHHRIDRQ